MNLQYIADKSGHTTAVQLQIPIEDWNELKKKYKEFEEEENASSFQVPDWQVELGRKELARIASGEARLVSWEEARKRYKK